MRTQKDDGDNPEHQELQPNLAFLGMNELRHESHESDRDFRVENVKSGPGAMTRSAIPMKKSRYWFI